MPFVLRSDDLQRLLLCVQRSAVTLVRHENGRTLNLGINLGNREDNLISIAGSSENVAGHSFTHQRLAEWNTRFLEDVVQEDTFVSDVLAVALLAPRCGAA